MSQRDFAKTRSCITFCGFALHIALVWRNRFKLSFLASHQVSIFSYSIVLVLPESYRSSRLRRHTGGPVVLQKRQIYCLTLSCIAYNPYHVQQRLRTPNRAPQTC
jgi:hypothetical protein